MTCIRKCLFAVLLAATIWGGAQESKSGLIEEADELQEQLDELQNQVDSRLQIHGFISQGYMRSTDNNWLTESDQGSFDYNEFGLSFMTTLSDDLQLGMQLFSRELGDFTTDGIAIDWAYADYAYRDWLGFRAGRLKTPMGMYGETRDVDVVRTNILLPQAVYDERLRDIFIAVNGASLYGAVDLGFFGTLDYQGWYGGSTVDPENGLDKFFAYSGLFVLNDVDVREQIGGFGSWSTPLEGLRFATSFNRYNKVGLDMTTDAGFAIPGLGAAPGLQVDGEIDHLDVSVVGIEYSFWKLLYSAEYYRMRGEITLNVNAQPLRDLGYPVPDIPIDDETDMEGYYNSISYQVTDSLALGTYYGLYYEDKKNKSGNSDAPNEWTHWQKDLCLSAKYDLTTNWTFKAEIHFINGTDLLFAEDNPIGYEEDWEVYLLKATYSF